MPVQLDTTDRDFDSTFATFLAAKRETSEDVDADWVASRFPMQLVTPTNATTRTKRMLT